MGVKRYREKAKKAVGSVSNYFERAADSVSDYAKKAVDSTGNWFERAGQQGKEGYRRYKDPLIALGGAALGAILAPLTFGGSLGLSAASLAMLGGMTGASVAQGARSYYSADKAADELKSSGNYFGNAATRRIKSTSRQGGEGDVSYSTEEYA